MKFKNLGSATILHCPDHPAGAMVIENRNQIPTATGRLRVALLPTRAHLFNGEGQALYHGE